MTDTRYAVVLIHGQGEQRPMRMGAEFAEHVLMGDFSTEDLETPRDPSIRWRPEPAVGVGDTRRMEVRHPDPDVPDLDVFEFYWAPRMAGNRLKHFQNWFFNLLRRPKADIPERARLAQKATIVGIWTALLATLFYAYLTAGALFPVQIVQIAAHGLGDLLQFQLDLRLAFFLGVLVLAGSATIAILQRRYGWCLSFCLSAVLLCAIAPTMSSSQDEIFNDVERLGGQERPAFTVWGVSTETRQPSLVLKAAASLTNALCDPAGLFAPEGASRHVSIEGAPPLEWSHMEGSGGVEINDVCAIPIALANPVVFARVADSGHMLATILLAAVGSILLVLWRVYLGPFLVEIMGDSARYLNSHPENILARYDIRSSGITLFKQLHKTGRYDKIIVVAHSLGTIVAYDILRQYWGQVCAKAHLSGAARAKLDQTGAALAGGDPATLSAWRDAQEAAFAEIQRHWPISDFITLGSPLTHARLLLEGSAETPHPSARFDCQKAVTLSAPSCPPITPPSTSGALDPADLFAATRWTNLYFHDDLVAGPVAQVGGCPLFGLGVQDEGFDAKALKAAGISHNSYWLSRLPADQSDRAPWLVSLRRLLNQPLRPGRPGAPSTVAPHAASPSPSPPHDKADVLT